MPIRLLRLNPAGFGRFYSLDLILYYRTRSIDKELAYSILPDGCVAIHFWDSLPTLDLIYFRGIYDRFRKITDKDTVIDCGAHVGIFTLKAAKRAKHGLVVALEPEAHNYEILKSNVRNNRLTNVITVKRALTREKSGGVRLYLHPLSEGPSLKTSAEGASRYAAYSEVQSTTLDDVAEAYGISRADMIKISVNAAEMDVIKGGSRLLHGSDYVAMEFEEKPSYADDLASALLEQGFRKVAQIYRVGAKNGHIFFGRARSN